MENWVLSTSWKFLTYKRFNFRNGYGHHATSLLLLIIFLTLIHVSNVMLVSDPPACKSPVDWRGRRSARLLRTRGAARTEKETYHIPIPVDGLNISGSERFRETRVITCCVVDWRLKFLQRIMSSVVDSRRKPRAMKISSVVQESRRCGACTAEGATDCCGSETPATTRKLRRTDIH